MKCLKGKITIKNTRNLRLLFTHQVTCGAQVSKVSGREVSSSPPAALLSLPPTLLPALHRDSDEHILQDYKLDGWLGHEASYHVPDIHDVDTLMESQWYSFLACNHASSPHFQEKGTWLMKKQLLHHPRDLALGYARHSLMFDLAPLVNPMMLCLRFGSNSDIECGCS